MWNSDTIADMINSVTNNSTDNNIDKRNVWNWRQIRKNSPSDRCMNDTYSIQFEWKSLNTMFF